MERFPLLFRNTSLHEKAGSSEPDRWLGLVPGLPFLSPDQPLQSVSHSFPSTGPFAMMALTCW